ncbi:toprim domain-containing protein [Mycoplasma crocodyli]|uniref:Recombination protein RecR n=1 Tax=Mycoplasma crocodyli (strain ATCC 51981 / MP145) TaxID=512564 RepID=D5E6D9_MYCCM|nr:toprim domain-containing protein [Mycoplasma crocodyli]ADE19809.1 recombination protein RecR [Mycoplasma crocodyli MP145]
MENNPINNLISLVKNIDTVSKRQAEKIVSWIINCPKEQINELVSAINLVKTNINKCSICTNLTTNEVCEICTSEDRDNILMVVENFNNIKKIEENEIFNGKYFVFSELIKPKKTSQDIEKKAEELAQFSANFDEVILAISPTLEGEITNEFLRKYLKNRKINVSSISIGIPVGANIDYIDSISLKQSIINRRK